uniref:Copper homeostasis protein n=1 Tax=Clostridioides difficile TaxID=1496 RepID=A0A381I500_CLODI|nr:copper homeostasis protein [Clostridioides difficile]
MELYFGVLDKNNNIDEKNLNVLLKCCDNLDVTFIEP